MKQELEEELVAALEFEWCNEGGFMFDFRCGKFNEEAYLRTRKLIAAIDFSDEERISKRLVANIYAIPALILGNRGHVVSGGGSGKLCDLAFTEMTSMLVRKFSLDSTGGDSVGSGD